MEKKDPRPEQLVSAVFDLSDLQFIAIHGETGSSNPEQIKKARLEAIDKMIKAATRVIEIVKAMQAELSK